MNRQLKNNATNNGLRFFIDQALLFAPPEGAVKQHPGILL